jgi:hypothetical protein
VPGPPASQWYAELAREPAVIVAAEWVAVLSSRSATEPEKLELVPGGHAHAQRPGAAVTVCGRASAGLEPFRIDFARSDDAWRCPACVRSLGDLQ